MSDLRERFRNSKESWDEQSLPKGHKERFLEKLEIKESRKNPTLWRVAAATLLVLASAAMYWINKDSLNEQSGFAENEEIQEQKESGEIPLEEASFYYEQALEQQFAAIEQFYGDEDSKELIDQTKLMISELQKDYEKLEKEFERTGEERVVLAMIENYQKRIELLQELIQQLTYIKQLKIEQNEQSNPNA
jgi:molybdopterin converting factor small subunit